MLNDAFAFCLSNVVGVALWNRAFGMVEEFVLMFFFYLVFDGEFGAEFFGVVDRLNFGVINIWNYVVDGFPHLILIKLNK